MAIPLSIKASWDTWQKSNPTPNNLNSSSLTKKFLHLNHQTIQTTLSNSTPTNNFLKKKDPTINVSELLKLKPITPKQDEVDLGYEKWMPVPPQVKNPRSIYNAASLAYIGDCIYELYARRHFLFPPLSIEEYNDRVIAVVRCEAQDALLKNLLREDFLSKGERDILRWGKNIDSGKTRTTKRAGVAVYNRASSLETLVGYLYLTNVERLDALMLKLGFSTASSNQLILEGQQNTRK